MPPSQQDGFGSLWRRAGAGPRSIRPGAVRAGRCTRVVVLADNGPMETLETPAVPGRREADEGRGGAGFGSTAHTLLGYTLVKGLQLALYNLIFPLYAYSIGYDQAAIGRLNAIGALTVLVTSVPLGMLADRLGRGRLLALSGLLLPLFLAGLALVESYPLLAACLVAQNAVATIYWSTVTPLLVGTVPAGRRARVFALNSFFILGVGALGSVIGGLVAAAAGRALGVAPDQTAPLRAALLVNAAIAFLGGLPLWRIRDVAAAGEGGAGRERLRVADLLLFGRLLLPDALQAFGAGAIVGFLPLFFALRFGLAPGPLGWLFTLAGFLGGAAALAAPWLARRVGHIRAIVGLMAAVALCMGLTAVAPLLAGAILGEVLRSALRGMIDPLYTPYAMTRVSPARRGTLGGLYNVTYATGFSLGPLLSGWLQVRHGFGPAFAVGAAAYVGAALAMWTLFRRPGAGAGDGW